MAESSNKAEYIVGVDLGGTKVLAGVFKNSLECIGTAKVSTKAQRGVDKVIERIARCVQDAIDEADLSMKQIGGIGIGINPLGMIPRFLELFDPDFFLLAGRYTLMEQEALTDELPALLRPKL